MKTPYITYASRYNTYTETAIQEKTRDSMRVRLIVCAYQEPIEHIVRYRVERKNMTSGYSEHVVLYHLHHALRAFTVMCKGMDTVNYRNVDPNQLYLINDRVAYREDIDSAHTGCNGGKPCLYRVSRINFDSQNPQAWDYEVTSETGNWHCVKQHEIAPYPDSTCLP